MTDLDFDHPDRGRLVGVRVYLTTEEHAQLVEHAKSTGHSIAVVVRARITAPSEESIAREVEVAADVARRTVAGNARGGAKGKGKPRKR